MRLVIALGGNAMTSGDGSARPEDQRTAIQGAMRSVADLVEAGHQIVLTHGNGPQVGNLLLKNEIAADVVPPVPLDWCVAQTQATIGRLVLDALDEELGRRGHPSRTAVIVTRTIVDRDDPGFLVPTKPIGRYATAEEAAAMQAHGQHWVEIPHKGWRRVVASPEPRRIPEVGTVRALLDDGFVVVCAGGGGIPTVRQGEAYVGIEAVIDKDLTAALLAEQVGADTLVIATDVDAAVVGFGTPHAEPLGAVGLAEIRRLASTGAFAAGSMGPKVEAVTRFAAHTGRTGVITSLPRIDDAVAGRTGTRVGPDPVPTGTVAT
ncbi:carbamate kinase [Mumia zhuanghuii]|uniref:Carbamate kinase n=1 Tax=Mumia zhuanghuii TaxID=2585211 RepID=A0A5C4MCH4_9ACTN|nr:carbamate kinase [Mumia zhuanghuii]TNC30937.1 carbamate kinase [Mumia zhuanghuii]TNC49416.1 carbamate kinase [Mumia zhuanghuii]